MTLPTFSGIIISPDITSLLSDSNSPTTYPMAIVTDISNGGIFFFASSPPLDGTMKSGTVFERTTMGTGYWGRDLRRTTTVNPKWFGAVGDGVTDDLTAFNSTFQFVVAHGYTIITDNATYFLKEVLHRAVHLFG